ncbi:MAG: flagellar biosynthetic protein FliO [Fervidobacterium sp.]|uniref:flagellar biosynthetic protein FliO n=1 Tax=Fervidobacterium sp. TaxID=1871331 RepID=UPI004048FA7B
MVLVFTYWLLRRKLPTTVGGRFAKVLSKIYIDRTTYLVLVRILKEYYVILVSPNYAQVLKKLDMIDEGEIEKLESGKSFEDILSKLVGGKK